MYSCQVIDPYHESVDTDDKNSHSMNPMNWMKKSSHSQTLSLSTKSENEPHSEPERDVKFSILF